MPTESARRRNKRRWQAHRWTANTMFAVLAVCMLLLGWLLGEGWLPPWLGMSGVVVLVLLVWWWERQAWFPVLELARLAELSVDRSLQAPPAALRLPLTEVDDPDLRSLGGVVQALLERISGFDTRERNFTRDASHELRSPLTMIKMSIDTLGADQSLSPAGLRSLHRIRRASSELEMMLDTLLLLARESDNGTHEQIFVVNEVLRQELEHARTLLDHSETELCLHESASFALQASPKAFVVMCWQLIRNADRQHRGGRIHISILPDALVVSCCPRAAITSTAARDRHGFEIAIAHRISDRFGWPLILERHPRDGAVARIHFPHAMPVPG